MKTQLGILKLVLCSALATTQVLGQTTFTWTNSVGGDLATAANYSPNGVPSGTTSDTILFDGQSAGPVVARSNTGAQVGSSSGAIGLQFHITGNQTNPVSIITTIATGASSGLRSDDFTIDSGAGPFHLGNTSLTNALTLIMGGAAGQVHTFLNHSTNPATIYPNVRWQFGAGGIHTFIFDGAGDWHVTNYLVTAAAGNSPTMITKQGSGTMIWAGDASPFGFDNGMIQSPFTISAGAVVLKSTNLLTASRLGSRTIVNNGLLELDATGSGTLSGPISGTGQLKVSNGTLRLAANSTYTGTNLVTGGTLIINGTNLAASTVVSAGTLGGNGTLSGAVTLGTGTILAPGESIGTLTINNDLSIGGDVAVEVDKSLVQSNDLVVVSGVLTNTGAGTLTVTNVGLVSIKAGDKFTLFSKAMDLSGGSLAVSGAGVTWQNDLATDGSITALTDGPLVLNPNPPVMQFSAGPGTLNLAWPTNLGWILQTNSVSLTVTDQWFPYPGSTSLTNVSISIDPSATNVFFRMVKP